MEASEENAREYDFDLLEDRIHELEYKWGKETMERYLEIYINPLTAWRIIIKEIKKQNEKV